MNAPGNERMGALLLLGAQMTLAQIAPLAMSFYVSGLVGKLGALTFSSYSLVATVNMTLFIAASSLLQSLYFVGGRALGTGKAGEYQMAIRAGTIIACALALLCTLVSCGIGWLFSALDMASDLAQAATALGYAAAWGMLPAALLVVFRIHAALNGRAGVASLLSIAGAAAAAVLATTGMHIAQGDSQHSAWGATLAIALANWLMLVGAMVALARIPALALRRRPDAQQPLSAAIRSLLGIGWPIGAVVLLESFCLMVAALLAGRFWAGYVPVHSVAALWNIIWMVVPLGLAQAATQKVAVAQARGHLAARNQLARTALLAGLASSLLAASLFTAFPVELGSLLLGADTLRDAMVANGLRRVMPLAGALLVLQSLIVIAAAVLRGLGQTRVPLLQAFIGYGVIAVGAQFAFAFGLDCQFIGIWWGLLLGFGATALAVLHNCWSALRIPSPANEAVPALQAEPSISQPNLQPLRRFS